MSPLAPKLAPIGPDQVERALELDPIDDDPDQVAVADLADRAAGQGLGADVADAGAGRDAGEPGVGDDRDVLAEREMLERRR